MLSPEQGKKLIKLARESIASEFSKKEHPIDSSIKKEFGEEQGVFVTLHIKGELRGCIGFPEPIMPLWNAIVDSAKTAAFEDPRFNALTEKEFKDIEIEVSVLTKPKLIKAKPEYYPKKIKIGTDGIIIEKRYNKGLLLPQVAPEQGWNAEEFLEGICMKAGLSPGSWKDEKCKLYKFQAQIFSENKLKKR